MSPALKDMLDAYQPATPTDYQNAAREIVQEIALLGLWRGGFFERAAFYGGTALRIFHGLRRFSEDLDFTRGQVGILGSGGTATHLAGDLEDEFVAHVLGGLEHLGALIVVVHEE